MGQIAINQLILKIKDGEYVLPDFQRGFVWKRPKVKKLFNSLYKNYPTGSLLIWSTKQEVKIRGDKVTNDSVYSKLILDGQQRLTSIFRIFTGEEPPFYEGRKLDLNLFFNIITEEFAYWQPIKMKDDPSWIEVTDFFKVGDAGKYLSLMLKNEDDLKKNYYRENFESSLEILNKLSKISDYQYYLDEDKLKPDMEIAEVVKIFNLVNKEGRTLNESDLAMAHISMLVPHIKDEFRTELELLKTNGFDLGFDFLTTCLNGIITGRGKFDNIYTKKEKQILDAWQKTRKSVQYMINILTTRAYIDSSNQYELRTSALLVPLVTYVANNNYEFKSEDDLKRALYWLYNAMIWGRYTRRGKSSPLEQDIVSISKTNDINSLIENLRREVRDFIVKPIDLEETPVNSPFFNMAFIISKSMGAIDWFTGTKLHANLAGKNYNLEKHHIFPKDFLRKNKLFQTREQKALANGLLNRAFLTQTANLKASNQDPKIYLTKVEERYPGCLKQQFIPTNEDYWDHNNFNDFLKERSKLMAKAMNKFLESLIKEKEKEINYLEVIKEGEHQNLEFKSTFYYNINEEKSDKEMKFVIVKTISGFLNADGGTLLIGVEDNGKIHGLEKDYSINFRKDKDGFLQDFQSTLESFFKDFIIRRHIEYHIEKIESKEIMIVNIEKAREPIFIKKDNKKVLFIRSGNKTDPMTDAEEIHEYIEENWSEE
ncbi:MAG: DUF262 domain-containing protein [Cryomorphaceae bacterium]|jgi:hypothetical protein|nr:DUF262 domain-containing protein [Cryomorphaceae bacterium]